MRRSLKEGMLFPKRNSLGSKYTHDFVVNFYSSLLLYILLWNFHNYSRGRILCTVLVTFHFIKTYCFAGVGCSDRKSVDTIRHGAGRGGGWNGGRAWNSRMGSGAWRSEEVCLYYIDNSNIVVLSFQNKLPLWTLKK